MATRNGRYTLGAQAAQIEAMTATLTRIEGKLDALATWQRETEARLATGTERFRVLESDASNTQRKLENRDNLQTVFSAVAAISAAVAGQIFARK